MSETGLRILVIANLPPHVIGGAENQVARLVESWRSSGAEVAVAGHRIPGGMQPLGRTVVRTHRIRSWQFAGRLSRSLGYFFSLAWLALRRRREFDVVYCRGLADGALSLSLLTTLGLCRWPIMATPINAGGRGDAYFLRSVPGWRLWCRLLDRHLRVVNIINPLIAPELDTLGIVHPKRTAIPNGIPVQAHVPRHRVCAVRRLVWTGRLEHQKGLDMLLPALARCKDAGYGFHLRLLGEGELKEELVQLRDRLGLQSEVTFVGSVPSHEVRPLLVEADVFVLPSRYEGMSNSGLEAMEASLPLVCTRCGGLDAHVESGAGWVCEAGDLADLEGGLMAMFRAPDEALLAMGRRARELVETRFEISRVASANLSLMRGLIQDDRIP